MEEEGEEDCMDVRTKPPLSVSMTHRNENKAHVAAYHPSSIP